MVIICFPVDDGIKFEINLKFFTTSISDMTKKNKNFNILGIKGAITVK